MKNILSICLLRSSRWQMFFNIDVLKTFAIFTGKHLCWSLFFLCWCLQVCNFIKKRLKHQCFSVNTAKYLRTAFLIEHLWWLLLFTVLKTPKVFTTPFIGFLATQKNLMVLRVTYLRGFFKLHISFSFR